MRNQIAQTMMNIGNPPPQVNTMPQGGLPPGMMMAPSPLKTLMGMDQQGPSSFMGGQAPPMTPPQQQQPAPTTPVMPPAPPAPPPSQQQPPLFDAPPAVPGQAPPQFARPPTF
jgi:hypothetical protein